MSPELYTPWLTLYNPARFCKWVYLHFIEEGHMKEYKGKVAVITGAASGIGRGIAERCAQEGMKVVIADVEKTALRQTAREMKATGAEVLPVVTDVSKNGDVERLAKKTLDAYGSVQLLFNNAGVTTGTVIWESSLADWEWVLGVNLWGVIHGFRVFVPIMLKQDTECHIVNTASMAALISYPGRGIYTVTKHAVLALSEKLYHELSWQGSKIKVSVLLPGSVKTRIMDADRNRPAALGKDPRDEKKLSSGYQALNEMGRLALESGISPQQVANCVFSALNEDKFYIITHPEMKPLVQMRADDILKERNPTNPFADLMPPVQ
jgi:NADP-dependent 3-hydroxy acid dehydrogenase YdfG